jgi:hypothetical protein
MPKANTNLEAILAAIKEIDILSELLEDKNKNNLKMIVEGKHADGKHIGPYGRSPYTHFRIARRAPLAHTPCQRGDRALTKRAPFRYHRVSTVLNL